ncbi:1-hydroxy-2-methyl-2-(E)-butenyl 4-diphosphate synthase [Caldicellulosiruptor saccharolyticus DSM 8903]|uniref:4-hydroxy-3-methylbut-2-en-1-yl diphosphate synthase (flavodoxin) n=1 Tax=Caldicellulosiruptor saccharolyticus (strain ATCC 43494 / DSM 8903 / Tp8T 6331) TaxID=351627 RepID=ISPG_CALS8|nr:RecName: Full=4-hydroxy-3-methylbut-2-en-1-yl diphosphate synthase (flavodoxin); AltName: Full=1-hydroxy-2-methyl-2-(E)-butenyl 4-diphosphate synthase [Caldicellulosiruptor saccharolyticus DSM 8903]ABP67929.1 1-hydroxy-2-methyl-2-(E)-butenyl 4-diphosphate synthase [Caldicellulosiruptor saccharolyticus DSM 8903]
MTKKIKIGNLYIGGGEPIRIQSMTNTKTKDIEKTVEQILRLESLGCEIIRVAVPDMESAKAIEKIKAKIHIPIVADIHFDYKLALEAIYNGADKIRINPGNIGGPEKVKKIVDEAKRYGIPIRVGANSGSLPKEILEKYKSPTPEAIVEAALNQVRLLESFDFDNIVISVKSSDILTTIKSYEILSRRTSYPLHVGLTEAGTFIAGCVKSSIAIGHLLLQGIGDTIRVSLTDDPEKEVTVAKEILKGLKLKKGVNIISCPTCARCNVDLIKIANEVEKRIGNLDLDISVAIMGCAVNGPGEAKEADIGIACGIGEGLLFKKGKIVKKVKEDDLVDELIREIYSLYKT